jgi:hypothetical protein
MKNCPMEAELFRADGEMDGRTDRQTDRNEEDNIRFSQFCNTLPLATHSSYIPSQITHINGVK